ncbi:dimethyladenosine transferase [Bifidobacterium italicum]|uniref:Ribosomal RNA small subunit methyltransferase A n=1 Tax=Bifidobacterium italicum TaxID=1960968 RepID=A0A2A2EL52_9BIFI|nr:16S rRNA (adenine(1518)-N(6)/adenine(1519)-N(6))-dimethyltransferase RsmA [Bifidobacterium italicum]PAU69773.1 dimethyladenosine transferase [Bifidobacterium italicum]
MSAHDEHRAAETAATSTAAASAASTDATSTTTAVETTAGAPSAGGHLLGAADIRRIAADAGISPTKKFGQNFVIDPGTVRRIVREAGVGADDHVLEVGPGLGSLTLAILETGARMTAVEIDPPVAQRLPATIAEFMPQAADRLRVVRADALTLTPSNLPDFDDDASFTLVANLPYNVATPILLTLLERFDNLGSFLVMVQKEVADRLSAQPGSKIYGTPSVKLAWYGVAKSVGTIGRNVFWPAPNVDSALVRFDRHAPGEGPAAHAKAGREAAFALIDAAFGQRRKTLHAALRKVVPEGAFAKAGIDMTRRGETLTVDEFVRLADAAKELGA